MAVFDIKRKIIFKYWCNIKVMKLKKSLFVYIIIILLIIVISSVYLFQNGEYKTYEVSKGDFVQITEVAGKVVPAEELDFAFEVTGIVSSVNAEVGNSVKKGDILAR